MLDKPAVVILFLFLLFIFRCQCCYQTTFISTAHTKTANMLNIRVVIALGWLFHFLSSTVREVNFEKMSEEDLTYSDNLLFSSPARSKLSCLELCTLTECCVRFTYTPRRCRGHSPQVLSSDSGTHTPGAKAYVQIGLGAVCGKGCRVLVSSCPVNVLVYLSAKRKDLISLETRNRKTDLSTLLQSFPNDWKKEKNKMDRRNKEYGRDWDGMNHQMLERYTETYRCPNGYIWQ